MEDYDTILARKRRKRVAPQESLYDSTEIDKGDSEDGDSESIDAPMNKSDLKSMGKAAANASGGSVTGMAADAAMASGNPYAMAGGLALKTVALSEERKKKDAEARYQAKMERLSKQLDAINNLANISQGLRNL